MVCELTLKYLQVTVTYFYPSLILQLFFKDNVIYQHNKLDYESMIQCLNTKLNVS